MNILHFFVVLGITIIINAEKKTFSGSKLYKVVPKTQHEVEILENIKNAQLGDFWNEYFRINDDVRFVVSPEFLPVIEGRLMQANMKLTTIIDDVQKAIDNQMPPRNQNQKSRSEFLSLDWDSYHNLEDIESWLDELAVTYPDIITPVVMANRSVENREIKGIKINYSPDRPKPLGMIEGTLHAREWISTATVTWIIKEFLTSNNTDVRYMAENLEWHIFPVVNPDGYVYTFTDNRMWRKNRSKDNFVTTCGANNDMSNGVDLNRNFDFEWMRIGASSNPCLNTFAGPSAASEPETQAISSYILSLKERGRLVYYLSFHSFTQLFILPYSHVLNHEEFPADNHDDLVEIGNNAAAAVATRFNTTYRVGIAAEVLYPLGGSSFDWAKYYGDVDISYLIELRDMGEYGFLLPPSQIIPNNLEVMDGMIEMHRTATRLGYVTSKSSSYFINNTFSIVFMFIVCLVS